MTAPKIYKAIHAVAGDLADTGLPKACFNSQDQYAYRSIDDLLKLLAPLLRKHRLCVLPRVLEHTSSQERGHGGSSLFHVTLRVAFDLVSVVDSSRHSVEAFGEALDEGDKATAKAMSAAYKSAMFQTFCIPVPWAEDGDGASPKLGVEVDPEPVEGWEEWCRGIAETVGICESLPAVDRVQSTHRKLLLSLSRAQPELYAELGHAIVTRRVKLSRQTKDSEAERTQDAQPKRGKQLKPGASRELAAEEA